MNTQTNNQSQSQRAANVGEPIFRSDAAELDDEAASFSKFHRASSGGGTPFDDNPPDDDTGDPKANKSVPIGGVPFDDNPPDDGTGGPKTNKSIPADDR